MEIILGFEIEQPKKFIPWHIDEEQLKLLLGEHDLKHITDGYYTVQCISLGGISHRIGFHFEPRKSGVLNELEFFCHSSSDVNISYHDFQGAFEILLGQPTESEEGAEGFKTHQWHIGSISALHLVHNRFVIEERLRIKKEI